MLFMVKIIPAILPTTKEEFEGKFELVKDLVKRVQLDVVDGVFAETKTVEPASLIGQGGWLRSVGEVKLDVHLMVDEPIEWLEQCKAINADRVLGQIELMEDPVLFVAEAQVKGFGVGLALDLNTEVERIASVIDDLDVVLLMSVKAGKSGSEFVEAVLPKIEEVRKLKKDILICVDGGLDGEEIKKCIVADWAEEIKEEELNRDFSDMEFVVGSALWEADDIKKKLEDLENLRNG